MWTQVQHWIEHIHECIFLNIGVCCILHNILYSRTPLQTEWTVYIFKLDAGVFIGSQTLYAPLM
jgi:hypothetical protein